MTNTPTNEELAIAMQAGQLELAEVLWNQVEGLVIWKAERFMTVLELQGNSHGLEFDDLRQTGFVAMMEAVASFKPESSAFSTWFMYHLRKAFADVSGCDSTRKRNDPLNFSVSYDRPLAADPEDGILRDLIPDTSAADALEAAEEKVWTAQLHKTLEKLIAELPAEAGQVLKLRHYKNRPLAEIAAMLNTSPETVRRLERKALQSLRKPGSTKELRPFVDFNAYCGTGLGSFLATGYSVQERFLIRQENKFRKSD